MDDQRIENEIIGTQETEKVKNNSLEGQSFKGQLGGARPGAGRPKGSMNKSTKEKLAIEEEFKARILNQIHTLLNAQLNLAKGSSYLYRIDEEKDSSGKVLSKKHHIVTDPDEIEQVLDECEGTGVMDGHYYYITTRTPDVRALDSLIDRVFGRAIQKQETKHSGEIGIITGMQIKKDQFKEIKQPENGTGIPDQKPETTPSS